MNTTTSTRIVHGARNAALVRERTVEPLPSEGFVRLPQVLAVIPVSRATWWDWCRRGIAPAGKKLSPGVTAWDVADIRAFIEQVKQ